MSAIAMAEPMKRKRRPDQALDQLRVQRKTKRIEKEIKRLEKLGRYLKPIDEIEGDRQLLKQLNDRQRSPSEDGPTEEELSAREVIIKDFCRLRLRRAKAHRSTFSLLLYYQDQAMTELKQISEELYDAAKQPVELPIAFTGPVESAPSDDYWCPDGEYIDSSKTYDYEFEMDKKLLVNKK